MVSHFSSSILNLIHPLIHGGLATETRESLVTGQKPATTHEQSAPGHMQEHTAISLFNRYFPGPAPPLSQKTIPAELHGQIRDEIPQGSPGMVSHFSSSILNLIHPPETSHNSRAIRSQSQTSRSAYLLSTWHKRFQHTFFCFFQIHLLSGAKIRYSRAARHIFIPPEERCRPSPP